MTTFKPAQRLTIHGWRYETNRRTGEWRAVCSCGWTFAGWRDEVIMRAVGHGLDG